MGKKSVVVEIMGKKLSPYGFQYVGYDHLIWTFSREVEGVDQYIAIQKSQWENSYTLNLYVYGVGLPIYRSKELTNDPEYNWDFLSFNNEQEQREVLNKLLDVAEKYDIDKLNELANEKKSWWSLLSQLLKCMFFESMMCQLCLPTQNDRILLSAAYPHMKINGRECHPPIYCWEKKLVVCRYTKRSRCIGCSIQYHRDCKSESSQRIYLSAIFTTLHARYGLA